MFLKFFSLSDHFCFRWHFWNTGENQEWWPLRRKLCESRLLEFALMTLKRSLLLLSSSRQGVCLGWSICAIPRQSHDLIRTAPLPVRGVTQRTNRTEPLTGGRYGTLVHRRIVEWGLPDQRTVIWACFQFLRSLWLKHRKLGVHAKIYIRP